MIQKTYILDTNVYGELLIESNSQEVIEGIKEDKTTYVYGIDIIENELTSSPIEVKHKGKILRELVLTIYKTIVDEEFKLFPIAEYIAHKYFQKDDLKVDFQIIAMASLKGVDIVISTDKRTILSKLAEETYKIINNANGLRTPRLVRYSDFKKRYIK